MNKPALQEQANEVLEYAGANELSGHSTHATVPGVDAYESAGQARHADIPRAPANVPIGQSTGSDTPDPQ